MTTSRLNEQGRGQKERLPLEASLLAGVPGMFCNQEVEVLYGPQ